MTVKTKRNYHNITPKDFGTVTCRGYTYISDPDTKGEFADNKFKVSIEVGAKELAAFKKVLAVKAKEWLPSLKTPKLPIRIDKEGRELVVMKTKSRPLAIDAERNKIPSDVKVYSGSEVRVAGTLSNYKEGLNIYLDAVQVIKLAEMGSRADASAFDSVEGGFTMQETSDDDDFGAESSESVTSGSNQFDL